MSRKKYRFLKEGETLRRSDIAKHHCGAYYYEDKSGIKQCHEVDGVCGFVKCYRRLIRKRLKGEKK